MRRVALTFSFLLCAVTALQSPAPANGQGSAPLVRVPFPQDEGILTPYSFELAYPLVTLVYDTLLSRDPDGDPQPWLARSVKRSAGGRRVVIRLRRGVRWHDGRPLTAADVVFTFKFVKTHVHRRFTPQLVGIRRVRAASPRTVTIDLHQPAPGFLDQPLADLPILPRHLWADRPADQWIPPGLPIGSGPYRFASYAPGKGYTFAANRAYFRGRPRVGRIEVDFARRGRRTDDALKRGDVDILPTGVAPDSPLDDARGIAVAQGINYSGTALAFNLRRPPFHRARARRAVAHALDRDRIAAAGGSVPATRGFLHPASPWAPESELSRLEEPASRREIARLSKPPIDVLAPKSDPLRLAVGEQVVDSLRRAGAKATLTALPAPAFNRALGSDGSEPAFQTTVIRIPPLTSYDPDYLRIGFAARSPLNLTGYRSVAFERLAERVARTPDRRARLRAVEAELRQLARDAPAVPLAFADGAFAYRPATYDGWISVKGTGAFDKRSFLAPEASRLPDETPSGDSSGGLSLGAAGLASVGLLLAALALLATALLRGRSDRR